MHPRLMTHYAPPTDPLCVIHRDADMVLVDKPSGLLSVPGKRDDRKDCLETRVQMAEPDALLIHRLDLETSGIMVFAMNKHAQRFINRQFESRIVRKTYVADVYGRVAGAEGSINLPLAGDWPNRPLQKVCQQTGKPSITQWTVLDRGTETTRLELRPETGRTHQLRVHLAAIGHPILGDPFYAHDAARLAADRLRLHALSLDLRHPEDGQWGSWHAPCPF